MSELIERGVGSRLTRRGSLSSLVAVFGGSAVLAACGGESAPAAAPTAAKAAPTAAAAATTAPAPTAAPTAAPKPVTIKVTARTVSEAEMWDVRIPVFQKENPGITVEKDLNDGDIIAKITTLIAAGSIGDVVHTHPSQAQPQRLYLAKSMKDLDALIARDKVDLKQWYPAAIDAGRLDGKVISLPFKGKMAAVAFFYNKTLFDQAGVKVPDANTTMADVMEAAVKLTKPDGSQWGIATTLPKDSRTLTGTLRRWNAELLDKEAKKGMLASTEAGAAFAWFYDAFHKRKVADPKADIQKLFVEGKAAMLMNLDFNVKTAIHPAAKQFGYEYSAILAPKGPTGRRGGIWVPDAQMELWFGKFQAIIGYETIWRPDNPCITYGIADAFMPQDNIGFLAIFSPVEFFDLGVGFANTSGQANDLASDTFGDEYSVMSYLVFESPGENARLQPGIVVDPWGQQAGNARAAINQ
ncbi:MAG: extracellular solute-binding protein, partial [Chloroflexi bacterium]|nr:extracellular solute-binding protein [Chloroflexota bacterium]